MRVSFSNGRSGSARRRTRFWNTTVCCHICVRGVTGLQGSTHHLIFPSQFGVHCDTGYIWYEGPKLYAVSWLREREGKELN